MHSPDYINIAFHCDSKTTFISHYRFEKPVIHFSGNDFNQSFCTGDHPDEYMQIAKSKKWMIDIISSNTNKDDNLYICHKMKVDKILKYGIKLDTVKKSLIKTIKDHG
jgi:hypothetical protein